MVCRGCCDRVEKGLPVSFRENPEDSWNSVVSLGISLVDGVEGFGEFMTALGVEHVAQDAVGFDVVPFLVRVCLACQFVKACDGLFEKFARGVR